MQLTRSQDTLAEASRPAFYAGRKLSEVEQALLWGVLQEDPECPSWELLDKVARRQRAIAVSLRQVNRWRVTYGLNRRQGRPRQAEGLRPVGSGAEIVRIMPHVSFVGVHLFAHWLDPREAFAPVVTQLIEAVEAYKQTHLEDDFALLHHRQTTLLHRFQALFFAPLLGIDHLSEFDTRAPPLQTLIGRSYQSSTLSPFLGQLERVGAADTLMPVLLAEPAGPIIYVDGHMIAFYVAAVVKPPCTFFSSLYSFIEIPDSLGNTYPTQMFASAHLSSYNSCRGSVSTRSRIFMVDSEEPLAV